MSLESFLIALLEDKQIDSFDVEIIEDNALNTSQSKLSLEPEEPRCKWSQLKRLDSDSQLIRPRLRASKGLGRHAMNDKSQSDPSLLRMPQRLASPNNNMRKPLTLPRQAGELRIRRGEPRLTQGPALPPPAVAAGPVRPSAWTLT